MKLGLPEIIILVLVVGAIYFGFRLLTKSTH
jgi:hypothetical protein